MCAVPVARCVALRCHEQTNERTNNRYINSSFENITSIKGSLVLLKKLQRVLQRDTLSRSLDNKFLLIFHNYGLDLNAVQDIYEKYKHNPPMPRNTPPVTGNILFVHVSGMHAR